MLVTARVRVAAATIAIASACFSAVPASADGIENVYEQTIVPGANTAIKSVLEEEERKREAARRQASAPVTPSTSLLPNGTVAQVPPVDQQPIGEKSGSRPVSATAPTFPRHIRTATSVRTAKAG